MRNKLKVPQWIPTALLVVLVPVIGYLAITNVEQTRKDQEAGAQSNFEAQLIYYMHQTYEAQHYRGGFQWDIERRNGQKFMVCYCDKKGYGWWYDVEATADGQFTATQVADTSGASTTNEPAGIPDNLP